MSSLKKSSMASSFILDWNSTQIWILRLQVTRQMKIYERFSGKPRLFNPTQLLDPTKPTSSNQDFNSFVRFCPGDMLPAAPAAVCDLDRDKRYQLSDTCVSKLSQSHIKSKAWLRVRFSPKLVPFCAAHSCLATLRSGRWPIKRRRCFKGDLFYLGGWVRSFGVEMSGFMSKLPLKDL